MSKILKILALVIRAKDPTGWLVGPTRNQVQQQLHLFKGQTNFLHLLKPGKTFSLLLLLSPIVFQALE